MIYVLQDLNFDVFLDTASVKWQQRCRNFCHHSNFVTLTYAYLTLTCAYESFGSILLEEYLYTKSLVRELNSPYQFL